MDTIIRYVFFFLGQAAESPESHSVAHQPRTVLALQSHSPTKSSDLTFPLLRAKQ